MIFFGSILYFLLLSSKAYWMNVEHNWILLTHRNSLERQWDICIREPFGSRSKWHKRDILLRFWSVPSRRSQCDPSRNLLHGRNRPGEAFRRHNSWDDLHVSANTLRETYKCTEARRILYALWYRRSGGSLPYNKWYLEDDMDFIQRKVYWEGGWTDKSLWFFGAWQTLQDCNEDFYSQKGDNIKKLDEENNLVRAEHWIPSLYPPNINFIPRRVIVM